MNSFIDLKQYSQLIEAFDNSPLPFAILNSQLNIAYANKVILSKYPQIDNPVNLYLLFEEIDKQTIIGYLKSEHCYEFYYDLPQHKNAKITLTALFSKDDNIEFVGATALVSPKNEDFSVLPLEKNSDKITTVNREFRDRITMMFTSVFALSHTKDFEPSPRVCDFINNINQNCFQLLRISDNLTKIMGLSAQKDHADFKLINLSVYLKKHIETIIRMDNKNRVPIEFDCQCDSLPVRVDLLRMEFAISNIILNSIKYTRDGNKIKVTLSKVNNNAVITISDKGAGIPKDILSKIGTPYYSYSHSGQFDAGFGIGLYIAKRYIASNSGNFSIQSKEGVGTTVTISIPLDIEKEDGLVTEIILESPPKFEPEYKFSQTSIQLSEVCYYPAL